MTDLPKATGDGSVLTNVPDHIGFDVSAPRSNNNDYRAAMKSGENTADKYLPSAPIIAGGTQQDSIDVDGSKRDYSVHVPANWDGKKPLPVMYFLNGISPGDPKDTFTGLAEQADKKGFMLVDIVGAGPMHSFNNGQEIFDDGKDENKYLNAVHQKLRSQFPLDEARQALVGFSQGGSEAHKLAAENDWVSSVASVEGYMTGKEAPLNRPVSSLIINAKGDDVVPIGGTGSLDAPAAANAGLNLLTPFAPLIPAAIGAVKGANATPKGDGGFLSGVMSKVKGAVSGATAELADLTVAPILENFGFMDGKDNYVEPQGYAVQNYVKAIQPNAPAIVTSDNGDTSQSFKNTTSGAEVKAIQLARGTHGWAGSKVHTDDIPGIGEPNETIDASNQISQFILDHPAGH